MNWFGQLPQGWQPRRLKFAAPLRTARSSAAVSDLPYVGLENVESGTGRLIEGSLTEVAATGTSALFHEGDVLFGKLRPYLAKATVAPGAGLCSTEFLVLRPGADFSSRFLLYLLLTPSLIDLVDSSTFGAKMPRASWDFVGNLEIPVPSSGEQRHIADFLDRETARIDELIAQKERMIELLEEKRTALITQAVTRGLDPDVELKDSGVEWLGRIPSHWRAAKYKELLRERHLRSRTGDEELLTVSHLTGVTRRTEKEVHMIQAESHEGYKLCLNGDLVVNTMWAWMGALGVAQEDGMVSPSYNVYTPDAAKLDPEFLDYLVRIPPHVAELTRYSKGIWRSRLRLYPDELREIQVPLPPLSEQRSIAHRLAQAADTGQRLLKGVGRAITLLREYRSALISAAVTGKISIPEANDHE